MNCGVQSKSELDSCQPLVSVLMPVYNARAYIAEAIESLLDQSYQNLEIVIIDDGSTDGSERVVEKYIKNDSRIRLWRQSNGGIVQALNLGINLCKGEYVARADADDICRRGRIETQLRFLVENTEYGIVGSWVKLFGAKNEIWHHRKEDNFIRNMMFFKTCGFSHSSVMFRKSVLDEFRYNSEFPHVEDVELFMRVSRESAWKFANIPEVLVDYRTHEEQVSEKYQRKQNLGFYALTKRHIRNVYPEVNDYDMALHKSLCEGSTSQTLNDFLQKGKWLEKLSKCVRREIGDDYFVFKEKWVDYGLLHKNMPGFNEAYKKISISNDFVFLNERMLQSESQAA